MLFKDVGIRKRSEKGLWPWTCSGPGFGRSPKRKEDERKTRGGGSVKTA